MNDESPQLISCRFRPRDRMGTGQLTDCGHRTTSTGSQILLEFPSNDASNLPIFLAWAVRFGLGPQFFAIDFHPILMGRLSHVATSLLVSRIYTD